MIDNMKNIGQPHVPEHLRAFTFDDLPAVLQVYVIQFPVSVKTFVSHLSLQHLLRQIGENVEYVAYNEVI